MSWQPGCGQNAGSVKSTLLIRLGLFAMSLPLVALAHHSVANFDMKQSRTLTGTVTYFSFTNPHSYFDIDVKDARGRVQHYKAFTLARVALTRSGWTTGDLKGGDQVTFTSNPDRKNPQYVYLRSIVFASGKTWNQDKVF